MLNAIFDIDGTLADASHRLKFLEETPKNWDAFFNPDNMSRDRFLYHTRDLLLLILRNGGRVAFLTGRPERTRRTSTLWLHDYLQMNMMDQFIHPLGMRANDDRRPSHEVKLDLLNNLRSLGLGFDVAFEDRAADAEMYRKEGLLVYQVAEGNY